MAITVQQKQDTIFSIVAANRAQVTRSSGSVVYVWRPARGLLVTRVEGVLKLDGALAIETMLRRIVSEDARFSAFHDWATMTDYETESRVRLTRVGVEVRDAVESVHILLASRIVALGVQAANLVLKYLTVHTSPLPFHSALREAVHRRH